MNLKQRLALYLGLAFSLLFGVAVLFIYFSFSAFRVQEFSDRLEEEALSDINVLIKAKEIDNQLFNTIGRNSIHKLYNEKTLIFDDKERLIYSSIDEAIVKYDPADLKILRQKQRFFKSKNDKELLGLYFQSNRGNYYVLIAAEDKYGNSKLQYLAYTLLLVFLVGSLSVWIITFFIVVHLLKPLDALQEKIADITVHELNTQLPESKRKDEINLLSKSFNQMLRRIENAYNAQREFTSNASHELRTPISRLGLQLTNLMQQPHSEATTTYLKSMSNDVGQMADLVQALLLLGKITQASTKKQLKTARIDEVIFDAYKVVKKQFPDFQMVFEIADNRGYIPELEIQANRSLLEIVFVNLLKNAALYADNQQVKIQIGQADETSDLQIILTNTGQAIEQNASKIFEPFVRGENARGKAGSGLGLRIVKRILDFHGADIAYRFTQPNTHRFVLGFGG